MLNSNNTKQQGNIGLAAAILYFTKKLYTVSLPLNDSQDYDLIVDINNSLCRVQVKTTTYKTAYGIYQVSLRSSGGTSGTVYKKVIDTIIDYVFILTSDSTMYMIPFIEVNNSSTINLGDKYKKYVVE